MAARFNSRNLFCSHPAEFGSIWTYGAPHAVEDMLDPNYFRPATPMLSPGDMLRLCRTEGAVLSDPDNFVHEVQTVNVLRSSAAAVELEVATSGGKVAKPRRQKRPSPMREAKEAREQQNIEQAETYVSAQGEVRQNADGKTFDVFVDNHRVAEAVETNEQAIQIAIGAQPLPKAA